MSEPMAEVPGFQAAENDGRVAVRGIIRQGPAPIEIRITVEALEELFYRTSIPREHLVCLFERNREGIRKAMNSHATVLLALVRDSYEAMAKNQPRELEQWLSE